MTATASRELPTPLTVLTYQAVCTLGYGDSAPDRSVDSDTLFSLLHATGQFSCRLA